MRPIVCHMPQRHRTPQGTRGRTRISVRRGTPPGPAVAIAPGPRARAPIMAFSASVKPPLPPRATRWGKQPTPPSPTGRAQLIHVPTASRTRPRGAAPSRLPNKASAIPEPVHRSGGWCLCLPQSHPSLLFLSSRRHLPRFRAFAFPPPPSTHTTSGCFYLSAPWHTAHHAPPAAAPGLCCQVPSQSRRVKTLLTCGPVLER